MSQGEGWVQGFLLQFRDQQLLAFLDDYEDYSPQRSPQDNIYERQMIPVFDPQQIPLASAWAYLMTPAKIQALGGQWLPTGHWGQ